MSGLPTFFRDLVSTEALPLGGFSAAAFQGRTARELKIIATQAADLLGVGLGTALIEAGVDRGTLPAPLTSAELRADPEFAAVLAGSATVGERTQGPLAQTVQRLLMTLGARVPHAPAALRLPTWGADGSIGAETLGALAAARAAFGVTAEGPLGAVDARALLEQLEQTEAPNWFAPLPPEARVSPGGRRIVEIAQAILAATAEAPYTQTMDGEEWRYHAEVFGVAAWTDGHLRAPGGVSYGLNTSNTGYWKCNIFGGVILTLAGLPNAAFYWHPKHRTKHFPLAERFGPELSRLPGWRMVRHLNHCDTADETTALVGPAQQAEIEELLREVLPGDVLLVDHPGDPGSNGGHTRVCIRAAEPDDADAAPLFAQARYHAAEAERDGVAELGGGAELQFWLLRYTG